MLRFTKIIPRLTLGVGLYSVAFNLPLQAQTPEVQENSIPKEQHLSELQQSFEPKYPNGISEHQDKSRTEVYPPNVDVRPDPSIQVGPGVVVGPNVYVRGKPMPNPLLEDVLPPNHPLLTSP